MSGEVIGIDIGGSGIRGARIGPEGPQEAYKVSLNSRASEPLLEQVCGVASRLGPKEPLVIGVPGFVRDGVVLGSPNLPDLAGVDLRKELSARLNREVHVENDANLSAMGAWHCFGRPSTMILLTLGTGVGGGIVLDGQLMKGSTGVGGEVGHIFAGGEQVCACGGVGCLETWVGTEGLKKRAQAFGQTLSGGRELVELATHGEGWATALLEDAALALGRGLVTLVNLFNPEVVVIAGGLTAARSWLEPGAVGHLQRHGIGPSVGSMRLEWTGRAEELTQWGALAVAGAADER